MSRLLAAAVALLPAPAAVPATTDIAPPTLHSVQLSRTDVAVRGIAVERLTVSVRLTDESGVSAEAGLAPAARVGPAEVRLTLTSGTAADGLWSGTAPVTSDWISNLHRTTSVSARDVHGNFTAVDPRTVVLNPSVRVTSSRRPVLALAIAPDPATVGDTLTRTVTVTDPATGRAWPGVPVMFAHNETCQADIPPGRAGVTDAAGRISATLAPGHLWDARHCAWIDGDDVPGQRPTTIAPAVATATFRWALQAWPLTDSVPAGENVAVFGHLQPLTADDLPVHLQRRYPDGVWRTVNRGTTTDDSQTFSILATPPGVGTYSYRVLAPAREHRVAATSPVFTIRGT